MGKQRASGLPLLADRALEGLLEQLEQFPGAAGVAAPIVCHAGARSSSRLIPQARDRVSYVRRSSCEIPAETFNRLRREMPDASASASNVIPLSACCRLKISGSTARLGSGGAADEGTHLGNPSPS